MSDAELLPTADSAGVRRFVGELLRPQRARVSVMLLVLLAATSIGLVGPWIVGAIVNAVRRGDTEGHIAILAVVLIVAAIGQALVGGVAEVLVARIGESTLATVREQVVDRALGLPMGRLEATGSGDLLARVGGDVSAVGEVVRSVIPSLAVAAFTIGTTLVGLLVIDWRFALAALLATPIQFHTVRWYLARSSPLYAAARVAEGRRAQSVLDTVGALPTVRSFRLGQERTALVERSSQDAVDLSMETVRLRTRFYARLNLAEFIGLGSILATGFFLVPDGRASIGACTAAALYFHRLFDPINIFLGSMDDLQDAAAGMARLVGVATIEPEFEPASPVAPTDATVDVHDVSHQYVADHVVLDHVSLAIPAGSHVAVVGSSGAGKSTLAKLVAGVQMPTSGAVTVGGAGLDEIGPAGVRRTIAIVTQDVHVFAGALADDLRLARPDATDAELWEALDAVEATAWAAVLPDSLQTVVGEGGERLDPGQAQQLALARVLLADPAVVVLDEATAEAGSLDTRRLDAASSAVTAGRTAIVVAHRLIQASTADVVIVMDHGRILEHGTHAELLAGGGRYAELWDAWSRHRPSDD